MKRKTASKNGGGNRRNFINSNINSGYSNGRSSEQNHSSKNSKKQHTNNTDIYSNKKSKQPEKSTAIPKKENFDKYFDEFYKNFNHCKYNLVALNKKFETLESFFKNYILGDSRDIDYTNDKNESADNDFDREFDTSLENYLIENCFSEEEEGYTCGYPCSQKKSEIGKHSKTPSKGLNNNHSSNSRPNSNYWNTASVSKGNNNNASRPFRSNRLNNRYNSINNQDSENFPISLEDLEYLTKNYISDTEGEIKARKKKKVNNKYDVIVINTKKMIVEDNQDSEDEKASYREIEHNNKEEVKNDNTYNSNKKDKLDENVGEEVEKANNNKEEALLLSNDVLNDPVLGENLTLSMAESPTNIVNINKEEHQTNLTIEEKVDNDQNVDDVNNSSKKTKMSEFVKMKKETLKKNPNMFNFARKPIVEDKEQNEKTNSKKINLN